MPRLTKIYTRMGDGGETMLGSGRWVPKDSPRVAASGAVDELNAQIGAALSTGLSAQLMQALETIQNELFDLGADLSTPLGDRPISHVSQIEAHHVKALEILIDELNEALGPLENFILPGGCPGAAALHLARTVCRRAERATVSLARHEPVGDQMLPYLNRLSDALFMMARYENLQRGTPETLWDSECQRDR